MKKIIFAFITMVMLSGIGFASQSSNQNDCLVSDDSMTKIKITIDFGRKSKDCTGFGICSITFEAELDILTFEKADGRALSEASKVGRGLELIIFEESLTQNTKRDVSSNDYLIIDEDYKLDINTAKVLGFNSGYVVKAGKYRITKVKEGYKVNL